MHSRTVTADKIAGERLTRRNHLCVSVARRISHEVQLEYLPLSIFSPQKRHLLKRERKLKGGALGACGKSSFIRGDIGRVSLGFLAAVMLPRLGLLKSSKLVPSSMPPDERCFGLDVPKLISGSKGEILAGSSMPSKLTFHSASAIEDPRTRDTFIEMAAFELRQSIDVEL